MPGRYYAANLVRWREGNLCPVGGWDRLTLDPLPSVPRAGLVWTDAKYIKHRGIVCDAHLFRETNSEFYDITPADYTNAEDSAVSRGYGSGQYGAKDYGRDNEDRGGSQRFTAVSPVAFTLDNWNDEILMGSSADGRIFVWDPENPNVKAQPAEGVPKLIQTFVVTEEHHLMTFGGDGVPNRVAWSDQGFRNRFDYTNVTGQAGFSDLEAAGTIYCARKIPGGILIFTQTSVWLGQYIGAPYFYGFNKVAEHLAPVSPQAVAVAAGKAYWMTARGFAQYVGGVVQPLPCTLDLDPSEQMSTFVAPRRVCAGFNGTFNEIWWFYPTKDQGSETPENNRYCVFNFVDGWWSEGALARSFIQASPIEGFPFAGAPTGHVYQHERGYSDEGIPREGRVWAEVGSVAFDDGDSVWTVTRGQVDARNRNLAGGNSVRYRFRGTTIRGKPFKELGAHVVNATGYISPRFSAKDFGFRVEGLLDVPWSVGALHLTTAVKRGPV